MRNGHKQIAGETPKIPLLVEQSAIMWLRHWSLWKVWSFESLLERNPNSSHSRQDEHWKHDRYCWMQGGAKECKEIHVLGC